jgi:carbon monoxide dehydrogenase subunit G
LTLLIALTAQAGEFADDQARPGDQPLSVVLGAGEQSGEARATIRIHAKRDTVWALLTSCAEAVKIVPGLDVCEVRDSAADHSWSTIHQVMEYSVLLPRVTYDVKATYSRPESISFERISGDLITLRGSWRLQSDGDYTTANYVFAFEPGFWVPHWMVRAALKRDLPKMLRALRQHAEARAHENPG